MSEIIGIVALCVGLFGLGWMSGWAARTAQFIADKDCFDPDHK